MNEEQDMTALALPIDDPALRQAFAANARAQITFFRAASSRMGRALRTWATSIHCSPGEI